MGEKGTGVFSDADFFNALLSGRARSPLGGEWIFRSGEGERSTTFTEATLVSECNRRRARGRGEGDGGAFSSLDSSRYARFGGTGIRPGSGWGREMIGRGGGWGGDLGLVVNRLNSLPLSEVRRRRGWDRVVGLGGWRIEESGSVASIGGGIM